MGQPLTSLIASQCSEIIKFALATRVFANTTSTCFATLSSSSSNTKPAAAPPAQAIGKTKPPFCNLMFASRVAPGPPPTRMFTFANNPRIVPIPIRRKLVIATLTFYLTQRKINMSQKSRRISVQPSQCPFCKSDRIATFKPPSNQPGTPNNFRIISDQTCQECRAIWSPPVPRWLAAFSLIVGTAMLLAAIAWCGISFANGDPFRSVYESIGKGLGLILSGGIAWVSFRALIAKSDEAIVRKESEFKTP